MAGGFLCLTPDKSQGDEGEDGKSTGNQERGTGIRKRQEETQRCGNHLQLHPQLLSREAELQSQGKGGRRPDVNRLSSCWRNPWFLKALSPVGDSV